MKVHNYVFHTFYKILYKTHNIHEVHSIHEFLQADNVKARYKYNTLNLSYRYVQEGFHQKQMYTSERAMHDIGHNIFTKLSHNAFLLMSYIHMQIKYRVNELLKPHSTLRSFAFGLTKTHIFRSTKLANARVRGPSPCS